MTTIEIILIGIALSMDAVSVSVTNGMVYTKLSRCMCFMIPLMFGVFQGIMPLLGYTAGGFFADMIARHAGIVIFLILGFLGVKMIKEGVQRGKNQERTAYEKDLFLGTLIMQAVATSIDAFAVGVGFSAVRVDIWYAIFIIALTTAVLACIALTIGRKFGDLLGRKAEIFGGAILVLIGIKALL